MCFHSSKPVILNSFDLLVLSIQCTGPFLICSFIFFHAFFLDIIACFPKHFESPTVFIFFEFIEIFLGSLIYFLQFRKQI